MTGKCVNEIEYVPKLSLRPVSRISIANKYKLRQSLKYNSAKRRKTSGVVAEDDEDPNLKGRVFFVVAQWSIKQSFQ